MTVTYGQAYVVWKTLSCFQWITSALCPSLSAQPLVRGGRIPFGAESYFSPWSSKRRREGCLLCVFSMYVCFGQLKVPELDSPRMIGTGTEFHLTLTTDYGHWRTTVDPGEFHSVWSVVSLSMPIAEWGWGWDGPRLRTEDVDCTSASLWATPFLACVIMWIVNSCCIFWIKMCIFCYRLFVNVGFNSTLVWWCSLLMLQSVQFAVSVGL